jgi:hypothetical protein
MPLFNNRGARGQPTRPYSDFVVDANSTCWLELLFVDRYGNPATPTALTYRIDNLTDNVLIQPTTSVGPPISNQYELVIAASLNQMTYPWRGSQLQQVLVTATYSDGSTDVRPFPYEVTANPTVS